MTQPSQPPTRPGRHLLLLMLLSLAMLGAAGEVSPSERQAIMDDVSGRVICPSCDTTLANSDSPAADRMREYIDDRISAGWTADRIVDGLVVEYGGDQSILAAPPTDTAAGALAWGVPLALVLAGAAGVAVSIRRWRRAAARP